MGTVRYTVIDGEIIAEKRNGVRKQYVPDPLGSTVAMLDNTQTQTDTFSYWPYGEVASRTGTTPTPFQYVGTKGYYTDSTSRTYVRARTLNTTKGRWQTQDPIGFYGGDWNLYTYSAVNPVSLLDYSGLAYSPGIARENCMVSAYDPCTWNQSQKINMSFLNQCNNSPEQDRFIYMCVVLALAFGGNPCRCFDDLNHIEGSKPQPCALSNCSGMCETGSQPLYCCCYTPTKRVSSGQVTVCSNGKTNSRLNIVISISF